MRNRDLKLSQQQEIRIAKRHDGKRSSGSGNGWVWKNDVRSEGLLWEMKRTSKTQITIKASDIEELRTNAIELDRIPVLHVEIGKRRCVIMLENDFEEIYEAIRQDPGRDQGIDAT